MRKHRAPRVKDTTIGPEIEALRAHVRRQQRRAGGFEDAWERVAPPHLRGRASIDRFTRTGVLVLRAADASVRYLVTQWLAGGGLDALRREGPATLKLVQVKA